VSAPPADLGPGDDDRLRAFLTDSLEMWGVVATVETGGAPAVARICVKDHAAIAVERVADPESPFRWFVRVERDGDAPARPPRPCGSIVGMLNALRAALGVERGGRARIV